MQRRKKVGGILDRRFGENDTTLTPEEKALERFVKEKQRGSKKNALFDLEDGEDTEQLTHFGQSLSFDRPGKFDMLEEDGLQISEDGDGSEDVDERPQKRPRLSDNKRSSEVAEGGGDGASFNRLKSKKEAMNEVIAKSKLYKYARQQAKEDDDDLRAELDKGLPDLFTLLRETPQQKKEAPISHTAGGANGGMNPDRLALLNGEDRSQADKEYDERLRQMVMDQRAKPTIRTLTEDEKLQQEAERLKDLEEKRQRRMRGESEESNSDVRGEVQELDGENGADQEEENPFGLGSGLSGQPSGGELGVEDEDEFIIEDTLIASGSEADVSEENENLDLSRGESSDDEDWELEQGLLSKADAGRIELGFSTDQKGVHKANQGSEKLAYTYKCPESHAELLQITENVAIEEFPIVVQRIRALYHPKLGNENKAKLGKFATILVDHISYLANHPKHPPFYVLEALIRHIHSLAKTFREEIGQACRAHLKSQHEERPTSPNPGDLIIFTAIASIFPTSDHFHQVVTPAMLCMTRYLSQKIPTSLTDLATGAYLCTLCIQYQRFSKRYIPEVINYILNAFWALAPVKPKNLSVSFPLHSLPESFRLLDLSDFPEQSRHLSFWHISAKPSPSNKHDQDIKVALIQTQIRLIDNLASFWVEKAAFCEVFESVRKVLRFLASRACSDMLNEILREEIQMTSTRLDAQLRTSLSARKPLRLHNHRPLAIKTSVPKFEESYNPEKHYDPDRDRAEASKLKAEHKRERKGALRELRKDASFIARETLKEKKERDSAYEKKYKRLVAEIQGEEGREAKNYEREKRLRKRGK